MVGLGVIWSLVAPWVPALVIVVLTVLLAWVGGFVAGRLMARSTPQMSVAARRLTVVVIALIGSVLTLQALGVSPDVLLLVIFLLGITALVALPGTPRELRCEVLLGPLHAVQGGGHDRGARLLRQGHRDQPDDHGAPLRTGAAHLGTRRAADPGRRGQHLTASLEGGHDPGLVRRQHQPGDVRERALEVAGKAADPPRSSVPARAHDQGPVPRPRPISCSRS